MDNFKKIGGVVPYYIFPRLADLKFMRHFVTTRAGGVSTGQKGSLNLATHVADDAEAVKQNRQIVAVELSGGRQVYTGTQTHSKIVLTPPADGKAVECDGLIIANGDDPAGVLTADCLPVIIASEDVKMAAVIHAGRQGVFDDIVGVGVEQLIAAGADAEKMVAAIAPSIRSCCYEVGQEMFDGYAHMRQFYSGGKLDMASAVMQQLTSRGVLVENVLDSEVCSCCRSDEFFSHRASGGEAGRFLTCVEIL